MMNGHVRFILRDGYLVIQSASKLVRDDSHARLFDLNGDVMRRWVKIAADALGEENGLQNDIDNPMLFKHTLSPKNRKTDT